MARRASPVLPNDPFQYDPDAGLIPERRPAEDSAREPLAPGESRVTAGVPQQIGFAEERETPFSEQYARLRGEGLEPNAAWDQATSDVFGPERLDQIQFERERDLALSRELDEQDRAQQIAERERARAEQETTDLREQGRRAKAAAALPSLGKPESLPSLSITAPAEPRTVEEPPFTNTEW